MISFLSFQKEIKGQIPNPPVSGGDKIQCKGGPVPTLSVTVPVGQTADWYSAATGGVLLLAGSLTYTPAAPGTYWAQARIILTGTVSSTRTSLNICLTNLVITNPAPPCPPNTVNLTAPSVTAGSSSCGGTLSYWQDGAASIPLTNPSAVSVSGTYYIKLTNKTCIDIEPVVVTINPVTIPVISGPDSICKASTGNIYTTQPGMTNYVWTITGGGTITAGAGTNSITVTFNNNFSNKVISVTFTNSYGCISSSSYTVGVATTLNPKIKISSAANQSCLGSPVIYTATTDNAGSNPSYQWQVNNINVGTNSPIYTYVPVNSDQVRCILTSSITCPVNNPVVSNVIPAIVFIPPSIIVQPTNTLSCKGSFTVVAAGSNLSYQWQVNTGTGWTNLSNGGFYSGATTSTLTISSATAAMSTYLYRCVISNAVCPTVISNSVSITYIVVVPTSPIYHN